MTTTLKRLPGWPILTNLLLALLTLAASLGLEYAVFQLRFEGSRTFNMQPQLWARVGGGLVLAAFLLATSWLAWHTGPASRFAGVVLLLVGLPIAFYPVLIFTPPFRDWLPIPRWLGLGNYFQIARGVSDRGWPLPAGAPWIGAAVSSTGRREGWLACPRQGRCHVLQRAATYLMKGCNEDNQRGRSSL